MEIFIKDKDSVEHNINNLKEFEKLYIKYFPIEEEREPLENILHRIENHLMPITLIVIETIDEKVVGGCISDYYPEIKMLMPIYLFVDENYRKYGIGKKLANIMFEYYPECEHIFFETENPEKTDEQYITLNPQVRLNMYLRWGYEIVPINYIQPPLTTTGKCGTNLFLMHKGKPLTKEVLKTFLYHFYKELKFEESDEYKQLCNEIEKKFP